MPIYEKNIEFMLPDTDLLLKDAVARSSDYEYMRRMIDACATIIRSTRDMEFPVNNDLHILLSSALKVMQMLVEDTKSIEE